jgi:DNA-directed RNA polymerase specialized sigma24 family protein
MKTKPKSSPSTPESQPATPGEIKQAIEALTQEDTERIEQTAVNRIYRIGRAANGRDSEELIQEAFTRILDGTRHWYKDRISFTQSLIGVIWSIASEWAGHRKRNSDSPEYASLESDLARTDDEGNITSPFDKLRDPALNAEQELIEASGSAEREARNKALVEKIEAAFADDEKASILIMGLQDGMDGPAIRAEFGISEKEFRTTMRRIQRHIRKMMELHHAR